MKRHITILITACAVAFLTASVASAATITVHPSLAPNAFGSPSYGTYVNNANNALYNGLTSGGSIGSPTYYSQVSGPISVRELIVTGFPSWSGYANPGVVFGAPYANELGRRLLEGVFIDRDGGAQFSISQMSFNMTSTDPANGLNFGFAAGSYNYNSDYWGILYGGNGVLGGGDDIFITSGPNTQLVDALVGRGSGNAWAVYDTDPGATQQDKIDLALADSNFANPFTVTGAYSIGDDTGSAVVQVVPVPEPTSMSLAFVGGLSLLAARRRKN